MSLEFTTAARSKKAEKEYEDSAITFMLDDREMKAYPPKDVSLLLLQAAGAGKVSEQAKALVEFFEFVLEEDDYNHLMSRMKDRTDPFETKDLLAMQQGILSEISGRPTE